LIYNNLIALLAVVLLLSTSSVPEASRFSLTETSFMFFLKGFLFFLFNTWLFRRSVRHMAGYLKAEQKGVMLAIACLATDIFFLDIKYFLSDLPFVDSLPVLCQIGGLGIYFAYLLTMWLVAQRSYARVTGLYAKTTAFLSTNLKINLALLLPWITLSLLADGLLLIKYPPLQKILATEIGNGIVFFIFFLILMAGFPVIMVRLWECTPLPEGSAREAIKTFCRDQKVKYREICLWPLFGGRMLTAGVLGIIGRFRYLLITPSLLQALSPEEVQAVMAHETGHVKRFHLPLYLFVLTGLIPLLSFVTVPGELFFLWQPETFLQIAELFGNDLGKLMTFITVMSLVALVVLYVRFLFGYFMRNFERQADVYSYHAIGYIAPLVRVFEKIALLSGNTRDEPSWHHFGIGQRVDFLLKCQNKPQTARQHDVKVHISLVIYGLFLLSGIFFMIHPPNVTALDSTNKEQALVFLEWQARNEPENYIWHQSLGDLQIEVKNEAAALVSYERALALAPEDGLLLNNIAWLLVTAENVTLRDLERGLELARRAVQALERGFVLDTLATALWMNGNKEEALALEMRAMEMDPDQEEYYREQMERFLVPPGEQPDR